MFEEAGEQLLKGKAAPVPAWRAAARRRGAWAAAAARKGWRRPFVGRADELRLLKDLFHATGREGRARLVSVVGPAGIGKSRLAWEFLKYVDGAAGDRLVAPGPLARLRRGHLLLGAGRDGPRRAAACWRVTTSGPPARRSRRPWPQPRPRRGGPALDRAGAADPAGRRSAAAAGPAVRRVAHLLRAAWRRPGTVVHGVRGPPFRGPGPARLHRPPARVEPDAPHLRAHARPPGAAGQAPRLGRRQAQLHERLPGAAARSPPCASCSRGWCRGCRTRPSAAHRGARGRRCPLYAVETVRMLVAEGRLALEDDRLRAGGRPHRPRRAGDADGAHRGAAGCAGRARPGAGRRTRPCSGQSLLRGRARGGERAPSPPSWRPACGRWSGARC